MVYRQIFSAVQKYLFESLFLLLLLQTQQNLQVPIALGWSNVFNRY